MKLHTMYIMLTQYSYSYITFCKNCDKFHKIDIFIKCNKERKRKIKIYLHQIT